MFILQEKIICKTVNTIPSCKHVRHSLVGSTLQINNIFMNTCMKERHHHKEDIKTLKRFGKRIYEQPNIW